MFDQQLQFARSIGVRMAQADLFTEADNPYTHVNPKLAQAWSAGFTGVTTIRGIEAMLQDKRAAKVNAALDAVPPAQTASMMAQQAVSRLNRRGKSILPKLVVAKPK